MNDTFSNPFTECTARDMSYDEVIKYWCIPFSSCEIDEEKLFKSRTPIFIEGMRGSGKTMILKYLSYHCQKRFIKNNNDEDILKHFQKKGSIGVYFRYKVDFVNVFPHINCSDRFKKQLFTNYFELLVSKEIFCILNDLDLNNIPFCNKISVFFNFTNPNPTISNIVAKIDEQIASLDKWIKEADFLKDPEEELSKLLLSNILNNTVKTIDKHIPELSSCLFLIIIDEYENAKKYQKYINRYIKECDSDLNITYRIGMRNGGMYDTKTDVGDEFLEITRDYLLMKLTYNDNAKYKKLLSEISKKRLENTKYFQENRLTDIVKILGTKENYEKEAIMHVNNNDDNKKHFYQLLRIMYSDEEIEKIVKKLQYPENPLIEMLNIVWLLRGNTIEKVLVSMEDYLSKTNNENAKKYRNDLINKYKYQLLLILARIYNNKKTMKKYYYSFNTFSFLSSGSVNDFISLCRNTFYQLDSNYFENQKVIDPITQTKGARQTAIEQMNKIRANDEEGFKMYTFVLNIGNCYDSLYHEPPTYHLALKYPETNQFALDSTSQIDANHGQSMEFLNNLVKWGAVIEKPKLQRKSIGRNKGIVYYPNHIFAPIFNISYRIRGGYNLLLTFDNLKLFYSKVLEFREMKSMLESKKKTSETNTNYKESLLF